MMRKALLALPFMGLAWTAAPAQQPAAPLPMVAPAEVAADPANRLTLQLSTGGRVVIQLRPDAAPGHVERIRTLVRSGFYNGLVFHRVIPGFMAQGGDPLGTGQGGSQLPDLKAEFNSLPHLRGSLAMARSDSPDSANSQFYIMFGSRLHMDRSYSVFGRVISGMNFVDAIERGEPPLNPTRIVRASIGSDNVPPLAAADLAVLVIAKSLLAMAPVIRLPKGAVPMYAMVYMLTMRPRMCPGASSWTSEQRPPSPASWRRSTAGSAWRAPSARVRWVSSIVPSIRC